MQAGQLCLRHGDVAGAVRHLQAALQEPGGESIDAHLLLAEALWQLSGGSGTEDALPHYEAAAALAKVSDGSKEGMIALGHGFALSQLGRAEAARERLLFAKLLAEKDGNAEAVSFISRILDQVQEPPRPGPEMIKATWSNFAEAFVLGKQAVIFMRGSLSFPLDDKSQRGASRLRAVGSMRIETVDMCAPGSDMPEGVQGLSDSAFLDLPQLYLRGSPVDGWLELPIDSLRQRLEEAGVQVGDPAPEPCHGTAAFSDGLEPWEVAFVELVSQEGPGDWPSKLSKLAAKHADALPADAQSLESSWLRLAPVVKAKLEKQPEMPCGHSCNTCPTRHDCKLHDAVGDVRDIEDLGVAKKPTALRETSGL